MKAPRYVICSYFAGGHVPLIYKDGTKKDGSFKKGTATADDLFGAPLGGEVWLGHTPAEFAERSIKDALNAMNYWKNVLSLRVYPTDEVGYITIDDIDTEKKRRRAERYGFALYCTTSPDNFQGVLKVKLPNKNRDLEFLALRETAQILNFAFGDPDVKTASQIFRFPNTYNNKDKHKGSDFPHGYIVKLCHAEDVFCATAQKLFDAMLV